ncbi:MAG: sn-glycerol-1-phosphate dehydrogenase [Candidatus Izemoplasmatales bacterium]|nr:sn-glycerol-1-phosphate dehydrogenase [Candidatus Izemoplasmatales bacterium]
MKIKTNDFSGDCACGTSHHTSTEFVIIESGCIKHFDAYLKEYGIDGKVVGLFDTNTIKTIPLHIVTLNQTIILSTDNLHANELAVTNVLDQIIFDAEVIVAFGSGTIHDIARYCAKDKNLVFVSCPTAASVDGFCSSVCAMTFNGIKVTVNAVSPKIVIADLDIIKNAPIRLVRSGIGDVIGKYIALCDWKISNILTKEYYCERIANLMFEAVETVIELANPKVVWNDDFYEKIMYALTLSGLSMQLIGTSRPASGSEHHFSHLVTIAPKNLGIKTDALHGESVGIGTIIMADVYHNTVADKDIFKKLHLSSTSNLIFPFDIFGEFGEVLYKENKIDCLTEVNIETLMNKWSEICNIISKVPSSTELISLYIQFGIKTTLKEIGIDNSLKNTLVKLSPYMRNRLTFARLLWILNIN